MVDFKVQMYNILNLTNERSFFIEIKLIRITKTYNILLVYNTQIYYDLPSANLSNSGLSFLPSTIFLIRSLATNGPYLLKFLTS